MVAIFVAAALAIATAPSLVCRKYRRSVARRPPHPGTSGRGLQPEVV